MKILFFVSGLGVGGKERRLSELLKELKNRPEIEFELAVMSRDIHYTEIMDLDIKIHYLVRKVKKDFFILPEFYRLCKEYRPDIVHCWDSMTAVYSAFVCKFLKIKFINGMIADAMGQPYFFNKSRIRANLTFPVSDAIVGNSKAGIKAYSAPENKSHVINNGFNFNRINSLLSVEQVRKDLGLRTKKVVTMVATFSDYKDYKTYFKAAKIVLDHGHDVTFLAIGHGTDLIQLSDYIGIKYSPFIKLLGKKSDVESYVNASDICVLSTFTEGISNSILEYMALGKPVVATDGGGTNELVDDKKTGFLVKPSDPKDLAEKIEILLKDSELRSRMGICGNERVKESFSISSMVNKFITLYNDIK